MTVKYLLDAITKDLGEVFETFKLENQKEKYSKINIYQYNLPEKQEEEDEAHFPFIIAKPMTGKANLEDEVVSVFCLLGTYDESINKQGYADLINMIEKYKSHLSHKRIIKNYEIIHPIEWELQDEDSHPLYYAGIWTNWKLRPMEQEEEDFL